MINISPLIGKMILPHSKRKAQGIAMPHTRLTSLDCSTDCGICSCE